MEPNNGHFPKDSDGLKSEADQVAKLQEHRYLGAHDAVPAFPAQVYHAQHQEHQDSQYLPTGEAGSGPSLGQQLTGQEGPGCVQHHLHASQGNEQASHLHWYSETEIWHLYPRSMVKRWAMLEAMNTNSIYNSLDYRKDHKEDGQQKIVEGGQVPCQELRLVLPLHLLQHEVLGCVHLLGQQGKHHHHSCRSAANLTAGRLASPPIGH